MVNKLLTSMNLFVETSYLLVTLAV